MAGSRQHAVVAGPARSRKDGVPCHQVNHPAIRHDAIRDAIRKATALARIHDGPTCSEAIHPSHRRAGDHPPRLGESKRAAMRQGRMAAVPNHRERHTRAPCQAATTARVPCASRHDSRMGRLLAPPPQRLAPTHRSTSGIV